MPVEDVYASDPERCKLVKVRANDEALARLCSTVTMRALQQVLR